MEQWTWCFIADCCAELVCVMLCFVCVLVFCCVAGGQEPSDWSNNTSLKDNRWENYSGMNRSERCEPCFWHLGACFLWQMCLYLLQHIGFGTCASVS